MCGSPEMESYEEFCLRSLAMLQETGGVRKMACKPLWSLKAGSVICFHGRAVLSPLVRKKKKDRHYGITQDVAEPIKVLTVSSSKVDRSHSYGCFFKRFPQIF